MRTPEHNPPTASPPAPDDSDEPATPPSQRSREPRPISAGRPRVIEADVTRDQGWGAVVRVVLERGGVRARSEREAVGEETVVLRCAAEATLEALDELLGGEPRFALVGAKRMLAFDAAILLACVRTLEGSPRRLIGCVPIDEGAVQAVVRAVLHATNRIVEATPNAAPDEGASEANDVADEDPNQD